MRLPRTVRRFGQSALLLEWEQRIDPHINASVHAYANVLTKQEGVLECVPAYASLVVGFTGGEQLADRLIEFIFTLRPPESTTARATCLHELPVVYGGKYGQDLAYVADYCKLSEEEVIARHAAAVYQVYFLGFQPGFAFLGELDPVLEVARKHSPRGEVPAGSVGLAGRQTGIYPTDCPGGWQLIGRCPLAMLNREGNDLTRLRAGDRVRFRSVSIREYEHLLLNPPTWPVR